MTKEKSPLIKFGKDLVPAHLVWKKMESMTVAADLIDSFNKKHQHLATESTLAVVPKVRKRLKDVTVFIAEKEEAQKDTLADDAKKLLEQHPLEEVMDILQEKKGIEMDIKGLLQLVGNESYHQALVKEAGLLTSNLISPEQMADLWNELGRPAPSGGFWTTSKVEAILSL